MVIKISGGVEKRWVGNFRKVLMALVLLQLASGLFGVGIIDKASTVNLGILYGVYTIFLSIFYVVFSNVFEKLRLRYIPILLGLLLQSILSLMAIFAKDGEIIVIQALLGISGAMYIPCLDYITSESIPKRRKMSGWGKVEAIEDFSYGIAMIFGGYLGTILGNTFILFLVFAISLLSTAYILKEIKRGKY